MASKAKWNAFDSSYEAGSLEFQSQKHSSEAWASISIRESRISSNASTDFVDLSSLGPSALRPSFENFIQILQSSGLNGPILLIGEPEKIGEGAQFYVYRHEAGFLDRSTFDSSVVAVKEPKFPTTHNEPIDLAEPRVQRSLTHILNEIKALTHEKLRFHPNIVRLLSWAYQEDFNRSLVLVLELAREDLEKALANRDPPSIYQRARFCNDMANGLDAIHGAGFIHGDLKPANVLIFFEPIRPIAKLADFGYAKEQGVANETGTLGWQAPEKTSSMEADRYAYGLLVWSIFLLGGDVPPSRNVLNSQANIAIRNLDDSMLKNQDQIYTKIYTALHHCLQEDEKQRPSLLVPFFDYTHELQQTPSDRQAQNDPHDVYNFAEGLFEWEIPPLQGSLLKSLYRRISTLPGSSQKINPASLVAIALHFTMPPLTFQKESLQTVREILEAASAGGNSIACDLVSRFVQAGDGSTDDVVSERLQTAVITGSVKARVDLQLVNPDLFKESLSTFQSLGGYNKAYHSMGILPGGRTFGDMERDRGYSKLQSLAVFGRHEELRNYLASADKSKIHAFSGQGETALYLACRRGSLSHVAALLDYDPQPHFQCTPYKISCLHWIIGFHGNECEGFVTALIRFGAEIDASTDSGDGVPFPHEPFVLPAGTALHWAVATSNHHAIKALMDAGANYMQRNGSDPYMYDDRIRHLYAVGGPNTEGRTFAEPGCLGLSPLDIAAINRDPYIFSLLDVSKTNVDINSADEEGFTVLHRLATSQTFRNSRGVTYWSPCFRKMDDISTLRIIVKKIVSLGGDLERLTSSADAAIQKVQRTTDLEKSSYTPLMLAMLLGDYDLVTVLLEIKACVDTKNVFGRTALSCISHRANYEQPDIMLCIQKLVSHNADVNHRSYDGGSALLSAAHGRLVDVVDYLLRNGCNIDERDNTSRTITPGKSIFAIMADLKPQSDEVTLQLLEKHVLTHPLEEQRQDVLEGKAKDGSTLMHVFAACAMPQCLRLLIRQNSSVNTLRTQSRSFLQDGHKVEESSHETPLDTLCNAKEFWKSNVLKRNTNSPEQIRDLQKRWNESESVLIKHGAVHSFELADTFDQ